MSKIKKMIGILTLAMFLSALSINFGLIQVASADDQIYNPECPNGCVADGPGCYCNGWHWELLEYDWGD